MFSYIAHSTHMSKCFWFFYNGECIRLFQASSHSSLKYSPLPKSGSIEAEIEGRRKSPSNSIASALQQQQISIKQEASDAAGSPQVHLSNPLNHNLLPVSTSKFFCSLSFFSLYFPSYFPRDSQKNFFAFLPFQSKEFF